jgi:SAM-dependent methyltransferase
MFDLAQEYDAQLHQGLRLSGENKEFFIRGRLQDLYRQLPAGFHPERILDFGCGLGDTTHLLAELFPGADIVGFDTSDPALDHARRTYGSARISFCGLAGFTQMAPVDLCYTNGVFHHILPEKRAGVMVQIHRLLRPTGHFALFENNPFNPGTRMVMHRIPFDREARPLRPREAQRLLQGGGFSFLCPPRFLFYFPRSLAFFRPMESLLARIPLGAQYYVLARK